MTRLILGIVVVSIVAVFLLWAIIGLAFTVIRLAIGLLLFVFCMYILYVFIGALFRIFRGGNKY